MSAVGIGVEVAISGDVVANLCEKLTLSKPLESLDWSDLKLTAVMPVGLWVLVSFNMFPVLTDEDRSSTTFLEAFHVLFATRVNLRSGLAGGEPREITRTISW